VYVLYDMMTDYRRIEKLKTGIYLNHKLLSIYMYDVVG